LRNDSRKFRRSANKKALTIGREVGEGAFGKVYLAYLSSNTTVAL
jgi:serine/threonine protein kinase